MGFTMTSAQKTFKTMVKCIIATKMTLGQFKKKVFKNGIAPVKQTNIRIKIHIYSV